MYDAMIRWVLGSISISFGLDRNLASTHLNTQSWLDLS